MGKRQDIITGLKAQLATISVANGYNTNMGSNVVEWRLSPISDAQLPMVEIRDSESNVSEDMNNVLSNKTLDIAITVYNTVSTAGTTARLYIEDVLKAISTDLSLGGAAYDLNEGVSTIEASQDSDIIIAAIVNITAEYQVNKWSD